MPYVSKKINIVGTKHDRRIKLTPEDKELIRWLREEEGTSQQKLADQFKVSKRLIQFVLDPEKLKACIKKRAERGGSKIYYNKEEHTEAMREHRQYKQQLYLKGEIKKQDHGNS